MKNGRAVIFYFKLFGDEIQYGFEKIFPFFIFFSGIGRKEKREFS